MKRATIYSIAEELGVHPSTVSRAFSRPELVKASVRERIMATADRLGYAPNRTARGLATGRTGLIGLLVPDITNPFFPPLVRAIERAARDREAGVLLVDADARGAAEPGLIRQLRSEVDGLVVASPRAPSAKLKDAVSGMPTVVLNRTVRGLPSVVCDNGTALREAAEQLRRDGHRRFALLRGPASSWAARRRAQAVHQWAASADGVEVVELGPFEAQFEDARSAGPDIVASGATAVLAFDDLMACGVVAGLAEQGVAVPDDVSVLGCDDVLLARTMTPALSTVTAPLQELGEHAVAMLVAVASGERVRDERVEGVLTLRGTTAPVKGAAASG
ncbi:LacI family DNA-binding transcriptional regulator [Saccharomonospora azurea]|uniref:LacI family DNA-binding transcriptional regulator n=1 Tax=Saccharomonospora azurea TaxID=40988 RepID=UPI00023FF0ED|nr:LacI family DNA-binding transcriptional regulator [Saccharomonospora azurea]EHK83969.1 periplasmic binding protein/LacI transcriptional regulator [Saccharomonospora azurea SZMC 14600]